MNDKKNQRNELFQKISEQSIHFFKYHKMSLKLVFSSFILLSCLIITLSQECDSENQQTCLKTCERYRKKDKESGTRRLGSKVYSSESQDSQEDDDDDDDGGDDGKLF